MRCGALAAVLLLLAATAPAKGPEGLARKVGVHFEETPLEKALGFVSQISGVNVYVDPQVLARRSEEELLVTVQAEEISVRELLGLVAEIKKLAWDVRWGGVFVSTKERLESLPLGLEFGDEVSEWGSKRTNVNFAETAISDVLDFLEEIGSMNIVVAHEAAPTARKTLVTLRAANATILDLLQAVLLPRGLTFRIVDGVVRVEEPGTLEERMRRALEESTGSVEIRDRPLAEVCRLFAKLAGVPIHLDPDLRKRPPDERKITLKLGPISVRSALGLLCTTKGLAWDIRWGGVFVSTAERLGALPKEVALPEVGREEWQRRLLEALSSPVSFRFAATPLTEALGFLREMKAVNIVLDPKARERAKAVRVTLEVAGAKLEDALALLLLPRGFTFVLEHEVILIRLQD